MKMKTKLTVSFCLVVALGLAYSVLVAEPQSHRADEEPLIARVVDRASVLRYQPASGKTQELYRPDKYSIHELTVSPNNKYIAAINISEREVMLDSVHAPYLYGLMVLHGNGGLAHRLDMDVRRYVWSPDGKQIAFLTFAPCRKAYWWACPTGAWILDVETSEVTKISEGAKDINWAAFDGAIYLYEHTRLYPRGRVMRWDMNSRELQPTDHHDIYFSPDGKYYLSLWKDEARPIRLYDAISNELVFDLVVRESFLYEGDITVPFPEDLGSLYSNKLGQPCDWVFNTGHYLMFTKEESTVETEGSGPVKVIVSKTIHSLTNSIYDVEQGKVIKQFEGDVREWVGSGNEVVVERDGKVVLEEIP
ncbi:MAG: WD40 repeat domain-containing protein [candidate division Zixibacteria bacterium]|nr:WD40 repeat domain-containing protein [candidate division Zixibacteria bacterium]